MRVTRGAPKAPALVQYRSHSYLATAGGTKPPSVQHTPSAPYRLPVTSGFNLQKEKKQKTGSSIECVSHDSMLVVRVCEGVDAKRDARSRAASRP